MSCFGPFMVIATWQLGVFPNQGESYNYSKHVYTIWLVPILDVDFVPERNSVFHLLAIRFPAVIYYRKNCWKFNSRSDRINLLNYWLNNHRFGHSEITIKVRSNHPVLFLLKSLSPLKRPYILNCYTIACYFQLVFLGVTYLFICFFFCLFLPLFQFRITED